MACLLDVFTDLDTVTGGGIPPYVLLHRMVFLLEEVGLGWGYEFTENCYHSEELKRATELYFALRPSAAQTPPKRADLGAFVEFGTAILNDTDLIDLMLICTALWLYSRDQEKKPWQFFARLEDFYTIEEVESAKKAYEKLRKIPVPKPLPELL